MNRKEGYKLMAKTYYKMMGTVGQMYSTVFNAGSEAIMCMKFGDIERAIAVIQKSQMDAEDLFLEGSEAVGSETWRKIFGEFAFESPEDM